MKASRLPRLDCGFTVAGFFYASNVAKVTGIKIPEKYLLKCIDNSGNTPYLCPIIHKKIKHDGIQKSNVNRKKRWHYCF